MEQISLWSDQFGHEILEIHYLCDARFQYDDLGFHSYPTRAGVDVALLSEDCFPAMRLRGAEPFLQAWLWFGLLGEALKVGSRSTTAPKRVPFQIFTKIVNGRQFLSTRHLSRCIRKDLAETRSPLFSDWRVERLLSCVQTANEFIRKTLDSVYIRHLLTANAQHSSEKSILNFLLACQILYETLLGEFDSQLMRITLSSSIEPQPCDIVDYLLAESAWCPWRVGQLPKSISFRYYLTFLRHSAPCPDSENERGPSCICPRLDDAANLPRHTHDGCCCPDVDATLPDLPIAVQEGKTNLCRLRSIPGSQGNLEIQVVNTDELGRAGTMHYIAISHVGSAGLGNHYKNSLPFCQVVLLQSLVDDFAKNISGTTNEAFFWIDTLCLPTTPELRRAALVQARQIFAKATAVLVLDPPLYQHSVNSAQEALVRIRYSSWKGRLWTLEECLVSQCVLFRFANRTVTLQELLRDIEKEPENEMLRRVTNALRPWPMTHFTPECDALPRLVERFADDMSTLWKKGGGAGSTTAGVFSKAKLNKVLRLGFLSSPKLRHLVEQSEHLDILIVWKSLLRVYRDNARAEEGVGAGQRQVSIDSVVERLTDMSSIEFIQKW